MLVYLRTRGLSAWSSARTAVGLLSLADAVLGVLFTFSHAPMLFPGSALADVFDGYLVHGLVERVMILCLFGLLLAIGFGVARAGQPVHSAVALRRTSAMQSANLVRHNRIAT